MLALAGLQRLSWLLSERLMKDVTRARKHPPAFQVPVGKGEAGRAEAGFAPTALARPGNHKHTGGWE